MFSQNISDILAENEKRLNEINAPYNPLTSKKGTEESANSVRILYDFPYWAARYVRIKPKGGGRNVSFVLNRPQRILVDTIETMRKANLPIRLILLKARQWGGSTAIQIYMSWLQLIHKKGLNSLIVAHQMSGSEEIKDTFDRMIRCYGMTREDDPDSFNSEFTLKGVGHSGASFRILERDCKIKVGTAERPDAVRGGDYNLVHLSEVGLWKATKGKSPEDMVRSATSGVLLKPLTMIVMESTANGAGTFFHHEYLAAKQGESQFKALFIPWFYIDTYSLPIDNPIEFAARLLRGRHDTEKSSRSESGAYLWSLWERGATLEAINWYMEERKKYSSHSAMAAEYPSDDIEAFSHSGERVFAAEAVEKLRRGVKPSSAVGEINSRGEFIEDSCGHLHVWQKPVIETESDLRWSGRYITVVDVGGRSDRADWSVITVIDRIGDDDKPEIVAQWRGHTDHDLLAENARRIAGWYDNALLVIESNTLETNDSERDVDGNQAPYILQELQKDYPNLYRRSSGTGRKKPGFHTNVRTKPMVIGALVKAVRENLYIERDMAAIDELIQYERKPNGSYGACVGCHDDMLMTRAIGLFVHEHEMPPPKRILKRAAKTSSRNPALSFGF